MGVSHFKREARSKKVKPLGVIRSTLETNHLQAVQPLFSARKACPRCEFAANSTKKTLFSLPQLNLCCDCDGLHTWRYSEQSMSLRRENNPVTLVHAARPKPTYTELAPSPPPGSWAVPSLKPNPNFYPSKCCSRAALPLSNHPHPLQPKGVLWEAQNANTPPERQTQVEE